MIIVGAGMSGLIASHYFRHRAPSILEQQETLPNNHGALLRFRSAVVSNTTGIPFRKMRVRKSIVFDGQFADKCNPFLANMYSLKVTNEVAGRSIWNMEDADRYIAPRDFIGRAANHATIVYSRNFNITMKPSPMPIISTMPMPAMMRLVKWQHVPEFKYREIISIQAAFMEPEVDVAQTIYYPSHDVPYYRASISGSTLIIEFIEDPGDDYGKMVQSICKDFGIDSPVFATMPIVKRHKYGKIVPIDDELRKDFMHHLTKEYNIYSLGRFATWRQILLDDVVNDCSVIERMIQADDRLSLYNQRLQAAKGH